MNRISVKPTENNMKPTKTKHVYRDVVLENMKGFVRKQAEGASKEEIDRIFRLPPCILPKQACPEEPAKAADPKDAPAPDTLPK
jgi:hypothetical protein